MARSYRTILLAGTIGGLLGACTTVPPTEDPVYLRMQDIEARLIRIERVFENESLIELASQVNQLRSETQALRGELETLRFETQNAATRQRELYLDVDQRLQSLERSPMRAGGPAMPRQGGTGPDGAFEPISPGGAFGGSAGGAGVGTGGAGGVTGAPAGDRPAGMPAGSDEELYQAAFDLLRNARYEESAQAFAQLLEQFPNSPLAANAQYWLAETHYVRRNFETALPEFQAVIDAYPNSSKMPDALLKVGFCNYELERWEPARAALEQVAREYPDTTAARLASQRLQQLTQQGG